ncbi:Adenylyltransferase and sulfurtransferase MOCS3 [Choanephora cucurbitarum]|uniref:Needs CLA4 to survive protein 3 n=1 Tax=Choanephora cucurbitarum TaxID=101091 RepID=A0A1C7NNN5_9FUNG|nr:Adenylyltransferase and sulfurtransferase MOCS3 [Choanephora cucurbitarum]
MEELQKENEQLRQRIAELEAKQSPSLPKEFLPEDKTPSFETVERLTNKEIYRFGRQLVTPGFGYESQLKLRNTSFLVVGAGGLGCPAALYLGAGGVGRLGIVDHDTVDINNLHRQVVHTEARKGVNKAVSVAIAVKENYPDLDVIPYAYALDRTNALELIKQYDIVIDATDNIATRYLLSDACVLAGKPCVSGSALRHDGQLTVYNYKNSPCFRCLHPVPPPAATVGRCVDSGVLGLVPGIIGTLEALEAMKVALESSSLDQPSFLILSAMGNPMFRTMRLRAKKKDCAICGENPTQTELIDYVQFCNDAADDKVVEEILLARDERVNAQEYNTIAQSGKPHLLVDVRPEVQYGICRLPDSLHIPIEQLDKKMDQVKQAMKEKNVTDKDVYVVCRLGNDSQIAVRMMQKEGIQQPRDIMGGLMSWSKTVDSSFPIY